MMMRPIAKTTTTRQERVEARLNDYGALQWAHQYCVSQGSRLSHVIESGNGKDPAMRRGARSPSVTRARHRLWTVILDTFGLSYPECAAIFEVDHTTIMEAVKKRRAELVEECTPARVA